MSFITSELNSLYIRDGPLENLSGVGGGGGGGEAKYKKIFAQGKIK